MPLKTNKGLGRGFGSLLPDDFDQSMLLDKHDRVQKVELSEISTDSSQPRKDFNHESLAELAASIKRYGILQPIVVTQAGEKYNIVAGERRFRAAKIAGLKRIPVLVRSLQELERLEISLVENVQRVDLNPIEQAISIARLHDQFNISYQEIANRLGKALSTITNIARLLQLPEFARQALIKNRISEGHARTLLSFKDEDMQRKLLNNIEQKGWSVRQAEEFASLNRVEKQPVGTVSGQTKPQKRSTLKFNKKLGESLNTKWGVKAAVSARVRGGGKITFDFQSSEKLNKFLAFLQKNS